MAPSRRVIRLDDNDVGLKKKACCYIKKRRKSKRKRKMVTIELSDSVESYTQRPPKQHVSTTKRPSRSKNLSQTKDADSSSNDKWLLSVGHTVNAKSFGHKNSTTDESVLWSHGRFQYESEVAGTGHFGNIYFATESESQNKVAIKQQQKTLIKEDFFALECVKREVEIHSRLKHDNILQFYGYFHDQKDVSLVLERATCDLLRHRENTAPSLSQSAVFVRQVTSALAYLAKRFVAHRDVKLENLLVTGDETIKLADFGWAVYAPPPQHHMRRTLCGTAEYIPPEVAEFYYFPQNGKAYHAGYVDTWALGVLAYDLVMGKTPFCVKDEDEGSSLNEPHHKVFDQIRAFVSMDRLARDVYSEFEEEGQEDYPLFVDFCQKLLQRNPLKRMSASAALNHPWLLF